MIDQYEQVYQEFGLTTDDIDLEFAVGALVEEIVRLRELVSKQTITQAQWIANRDIAAVEWESPPRLCPRWSTCFSYNCICYPPPDTARTT